MEQSCFLNENFIKQQEEKRMCFISESNLDKINGGSGKTFAELEARKFLFEGDRGWAFLSIRKEDQIKENLDKLGLSERNYKNVISKLVRAGVHIANINSDNRQNDESNQTFRSYKLNRWMNF